MLLLDIDPDDFWSHVEFPDDLTDPDAHWIWHPPRGKPATYNSYHHVGVHHVALLLAGVKIRPGQEVHHDCKVRDCIRPTHLMALSPVDHRGQELGIDRTPKPGIGQHGVNTGSYQRGCRCYPCVEYMSRYNWQHRHAAR